MFNAKATLNRTEPAMNYYYEALYHDLKAPLTILFLHIQTMEKENLSPLALDTLEDIKRSSFRIAKLICDANDRVRLEQGLFQPKYVMTNAVALLKGICETARPLMSAKDIHIVFESLENSFEMAMDKQLWERILLNLLVNGRDFSYPGDKICVSIRREDGDFVLSVRDFGNGVSPELESCVFSPYIGDTKRGARSGLGLYIVKELVTLMKGEVHLLRANPGTNVVIRAPIFYAEGTQQTMTVDDFFNDNLVQIELSGI